MPGDWLSVDEVARRLGLQPRTVRTYIRDGRLPAVRIGKQYRVAAADFAALTGDDPAPSEPVASPSVVTDVTTVVQITGLSPTDMDRLTVLLSTAEASPGADLQIAHIPAERRLRLIVSGPLSAVTPVLDRIQWTLDALV